MLCFVMFFLTGLIASCTNPSMLGHEITKTGPDHVIIKVTGFPLQNQYTGFGREY